MVGSGIRLKSACRPDQPARATSKAARSSTVGMHHTRSHTGGVTKHGLLSALLIFSGSLWAQAPGSAGTVTGTVVDPSGAVVAGATVELHNPISSYTQSTQTDQKGTFRLVNIPPNPYHLDVAKPGFAPAMQSISVRTSVPIDLQIKMELSTASTTVHVEASEMVENVPFAHNDVDERTIAKLPSTSPGSGLSDAIMMSTPGVVSDSNGFFHPLGDHAQTSFVIDGQPINDQQSKQFSTQLPANAIQSMELVTGLPNAEYGDKTSLVVNAVTRSGLGQKPHGEFSSYYGSFGTIGEQASIGFGGAKWGNFIAANGERSGRFLDTPEFWPVHAVGTSGTIFDHADWIPTSRDAFHLNLMAARNWFQVPNTYEQPGQDQRQRVTSFNVAPGYQRTFSANMLLTVNPFIRRDQVNYYPSRDVEYDTPATLSQARSLLNYGVRSDLSYTKGIHNVKGGIQLMQTRLHEGFGLGITDSAFNPVCVDAAGAAQLLPAVTDPAACAALGFEANANLQPGLVPYDLTRGGRMLQFNDTGNVSQFAAYIQDQITLGQLSLSAGLRVDQYDGPASDHGVEPRLGASYLIKRTGTVLRASFGRTFETPYNENLLLSSAAGAGGLAANIFGAYATEPLKPGRRNQFNVGMQQSIGRFLQVDADYFWKFTDNAYDFDVLLNTPIYFPISWRKSKLDGVGVRIATPNLHGVQVYTTLGHTRARFFGPENGGLIFNSPVDASVFRIDHDQAFQQTTNLRYQHGHDGAWFNFTWRYASGLVAGDISSVDDVLALSPGEQAAIGFYCGGQQATIANPITSCNPATQQYGAVRLQIPAEGTASADLNPPRIAPRHTFDLGIGHDNILHGEKFKVTARLTVVNLANSVSLYNFLSTFSGTHFVAPRSYTGQIGFVF